MYRNYQFQCFLSLLACFKNLKICLLKIMTIHNIMNTAITLFGLNSKLIFSCINKMHNSLEVLNYHSLYNTSNSTKDNSFSFPINIFRKLCQLHYCKTSTPTVTSANFQSSNKISIDRIKCKLWTWTKDEYPTFTLCVIH